MRQFIKFDSDVVSLLCCPLCKGMLTSNNSGYLCSTCRSHFPFVETPGGKTYDFRIHHPNYLVPPSTKKWHAIQRMWENYDKNFAKRDNLQEYLNEIDSVREIYTMEFHLTGKVLDIGGHQGRLRYYLSDVEVPLYISADPLIDSFRDTHMPHLLKAYPCLLTPCNFLSCHAENLPFIANSFDWVHMRSVVDHFADPYVAFKEAYRVLKPNGHLLVGLTIEDRRISSYTSIRKRLMQKIKSGGVSVVLKSILEKFTHIIRPAHDDHNFRLKHQELLDLFSVTGFNLIKEHWQKPPYTYVVYISAQKKTIE